MFGDVGKITRFQDARFHLKIGEGEIVGAGVVVVVALAVVKTQGRQFVRV